MVEFQRAAETSLAEEALGRPVRPYEIPAAVIAVPEMWTPSNGGLTPVGKIARAHLSNVVLKDELMQLYAELEEADSCSGPLGKQKPAGSPTAAAVSSFSQFEKILAQKTDGEDETASAALPASTVRWLRPLRRS